MLNLALIGTGRWGNNILNTFEKIRGAHIKYTANQDYQKLLKQNDIDGVLIATPGATHAKVALPFIKKGLPTFIEKPFTTNLPDAKKLAHAAKKTKAMVMVGHIHLYNPAYIKAKQLAQKAGPIRMLYFEGMNNGPYRDDMSALWDWAPHDIAMAIDLLGKMPNRVQAWATRALRPKTKLHDSGQIKLFFPKNISAIINFCWMSPYKLKGVVISGAKDTIVVDDTIEKKVALFKNFGPQVKGKKVTRQEPKISYPSYAKIPPLEVELKAFTKAIRTNQPPLADINHALNVVKILAAAEKSIALEGKSVKC